MKVVYSAQAEADIDRLEDWIVDSGGPMAAFRYVDALEAAIDDLLLLPRRCPIWTELGSDHRVLTFRGGVRVVYRIDADDLVVVRVFGAGQQVVL